MRNLLATRGGRLTTFFLLYVTEGIPLGFTATAMATHMRRQGLGPQEIATFVASLYLPWSWKWVVAPFVDAFYSDRLGRRRAWIVGCQALMAGTLLLAMPVDFATRFQLVTLIVLAHNVAAATQDVAIDALAVSTLPEEERGLGNGLMFAGAYVGNAVGGSGTLFLVPWIGFKSSFLFVAGAILAVTLLVSLWLKEPRRVIGLDERPAGSLLLLALWQVWHTVVQVVRSFFSSRASWVGLLFALLPTGAYALMLVVQQNLGVEFGLSDRQIAMLGLASTVCAAGGCVLGGLLSDRWGRRRMLGGYVLLMAVPTLCFAWFLHRYGWVMPVDPKAPNRPTPAGGLVIAFWATGLSYSFFMGLMYGTRTALFMDVSNPAVAATQFTAYMSLLNLTISYSAWWQGRVIERLGYPVTLLLDAALGSVCVLLLPWMAKPRAAPVTGATPGSP